MQRVTHSTAKANLFGTGKSGYSAGIPGSEPATVLTADAVNALQEEIANAIEKFGVALNPADNTQLYKSLKAIKDAIPTSTGTGSDPDAAKKSVSNIFAQANTFQKDVLINATLNLRNVDGHTPANIDCDGGIHADGTITTNDQLTSVGLDAGTGTVKTSGNFETNAGNVYAGNGMVSAKTVHSDQDMSSGRDLSVARNLTVTGTIEASSSDIKVSGTKSIVVTGSDDDRRRFPRISLASAQIEDPTKVIWVNNRIVAAADVVLRFPLALVNGDRLVAVDFRYNTGGAAVYGEVKSRLFSNWGSSGSVDATNVLATNTIAGTSGTYVDAHIAGTSHLVNTETRDYWIELRLKSGNELLAIRYEHLKNSVG